MIQAYNSTVNLISLGIDEGDNEYIYPSPGSPSRLPSIAACGDPLDILQCNSSIFVRGSATQPAEIGLYSVAINGSKRHGLSASMAKVNAWRVVISDANTFGFWLGDLIIGEIANSDFLDNRSNAIFYGGYAASNNKLGVTGNTFLRNHWDAAFYVCGPSGTEACSGGQFDAAGSPPSEPAQHLLFSYNSIRDGAMRGPYVTRTNHVWGFEMAPPVDNIELLYNQIVNNTGQGVILNLMPYSSTNFSMAGNILHNNRLGNISSNLSQYAAGNCQGASCTWSKPTGRLLADRPYCGAASCPVRVRAAIDAAGTAPTPYRWTLECGTQSVSSASASALELMIPAANAPQTRCSLYDGPQKALVLARGWVAR